MIHKSSLEIIFW